ncbi:hypothetical protein HYV85_03795 [Candidatus Woesearchaeota archaeon]|nr:hypothetical protein [Candidatus Woesearchaeota archaeon]
MDDLEIKTTDGVQFGFPATDTVQAMRMYRDIAELLKGIELSDIDPKKALLVVKVVTDSCYEVQPTGCKVVGYSKRPYVKGPLPEERYVDEQEDKVMLGRIGSISLPVSVTVYFRPQLQS